MSKTFAADLKSLAERLENCEQVKRYDTATEKQAWTLDLFNEFQKVFGNDEASVGITACTSKFA